MAAEEMDQLEFYLKALLLDYEQPDTTDRDYLPLWTTSGEDKVLP